MPVAASISGAELFEACVPCHGAAGALIVHETAAAAYPWEVVRSSWSGPQLDIDRAAATPQLQVQGWLSHEAAARVLAAEITREKAMLRLHDELPYDLLVETDRVQGGDAAGLPLGHSADGAVVHEVRGVVVVVDGVDDIQRLSARDGRWI